MAPIKFAPYGIDQVDPGAFAGQPGDRQFRGGIETKGEFGLNDKWVWGWEGHRTVRLHAAVGLSAVRLQGSVQFVSCAADRSAFAAYLTGVGNRSYFDARTIYYLSLSGNQSQVPVIWPVIDYANVINHQVLGGEVSYKTNFVNLTRDSAVFDAINPTAAANGACLNNTRRHGAEH